MTPFYSPPPAGVPDNLTEPSKGFRKRVIIAATGIFLFIASYIGLTVWFGLLARKQWLGINDGEDRFLRIVLAVMLSALCFFMVKSLFLVRRRKKGEEEEGHFKPVEVKAENEPELVKFIHEIADGLGAPRPAKIFLSPIVNASVSYNLTFWNFFYPTKKNLDIGLGLVNVLNIGEFQAILSHEFGHFAQRSMLLGRYVYIAQSIATRVVAQRDAFDTFIRGLSSTDLRIAWIGWIMMILLWAMRALIELLLTVVILAQRALSREMEFHADLVAVSATGSDALINALHKLRAADQGYHSAIHQYQRLLQKGKQAPDLYALQTAHIEGMRSALDDPTYGVSPTLNEDGTPIKVFQKLGIAPPEMWSTHPADNDREHNAKLRYIRADIDHRSSWEVFADPSGLRSSMTRALWTKLPEDLETVDSELAVKLMNNDLFHWTFLDSRYEGCYQGRRPLSAFATLDELYDESFIGDLNQQLAAWYPKSLKPKLDKHRELLEEIEQLESAAAESVTLEKREIYHRGIQVKRKHLSKLVAEVKQEERKLFEELRTHDGLVRKSAYAAAKGINPLFAERLRSIAQLVHYSEHCLNELEDLNRVFNNTLMIVLADGKVTETEMRRLLAIANESARAISKVFKDSETIKVAEVLGGDYAEKPYKERFEEYRQGVATPENIDSFLNHFGGWFEQAHQNVADLRNATLEKLVEFEDQARQAVLHASQPFYASGNLHVVDEYPKLVPGDEREIQRKLRFWDRFQSSDGIWPSIAKFAAAASIIGGALTLASFSDPTTNTVLVYNGLPETVLLTVNGEAFNVPPNTDVKLSDEYEEGWIELMSSLNGKQLAKHRREIKGSGKTFVYNIANGAALYEQYWVYSESYFNDSRIPDNRFFSTDWFVTDSDYIFRTPPETVSMGSSRGTVTKTELGAIGIENVVYNLEFYDSTFVRKMIATNLIASPLDDVRFIEWAEAAIDHGMVSNVLDVWQDQQQHVPIMRQLQDNLPVEDSLKFMAEVKQLADATPDYGGFRYILTRALPDGPGSDSAMIAGLKQFPDFPWFRYAVGYREALLLNWEKAYELYETAFVEDPFLVYHGGYIGEKVRRFVEGRERESTFYDALTASPHAAYWRALHDEESKTLSEKADILLNNLANGWPSKAFSLAEDIDEGDEFIWLVAASDRTKPAFIQAAKALADEGSGLTESNMWTAYGLGLHHNWGTSAIESFMKESLGSDDWSRVQRSMDALRRLDFKTYNDELAKLEDWNLVEGMDALAITLLKDDAPYSIRHRVWTTLPIWQRGFFIPAAEDV